MESRIFIIEDESIMAECLERSVRRALKPVVSDPEILTFSNAISAMSALDDGLPDLILLDVLLDGPDGFTFLNELSSYPDTAQIPVIIVSSLSLPARALAAYGVAATLHKDTMTPAEITAAVRRALNPAIKAPKTTLAPKAAANQASAVSAGTTTSAHNSLAGAARHA